MTEIVVFKDQKVPKYITQGNHAKFIIPIAQEVCKGIGLDIGCNRKEWAFPGSFPIDPQINNFDALNLPNKEYDYIFSSHCLEHVSNYTKALEYWTKHLRIGGILFLYLPHYDCQYWRPWEMPTKRHIHQFYPEQMISMLKTLGYKNIFNSERDLAFSFAIYGEKI